MSDSSHKSFAWQYFVKSNEEESAKCSKCKKKILCKGWSTSGLVRHLKNIHNIKSSDIVESELCQHPETSGLKRSLSSNEPSTSSGMHSKQQKITYFIKKQQTREEMVANLVAVDRLSVNTITRSDFIRQSFLDKGFQLPKSPSAVMDLVYKQFELVTEDIRSEIQREIKNGKKFSVTLDEYSSLRNKRYLNVNVHSSNGKFWNLGMIGISGKMISEKVREYLELKLGEFGLNLEKDIVCCVTDGASVMVKFGKQIPSEHHVCYAHTIHLAVCDVLYNKKNAVEEIEVMTEGQGDKIESESQGAVRPESSDEENEDDFDYAYATDTAADTDECMHKNILSSVNVLDEDSTDAMTKVTINLEDTLAKVRRIVKIFKKSPLKCETLQKYVIDEHSTEKMLSLDVKIRWNSLLAMIERFLEIKNSIIKALLDLKIKCDISEYEFGALHDVRNALLPIKLGSDKLCHRQSTLITAETVFSFIISELDKQQSDFAKRLLNAFIARLSSRANKNLVSVALYLSYAKKYSTHHDAKLAPLISKSAVISASKKLFSRLFSSPEVPTLPDSGASNEEIESSELSLSEKLEQAIKQSMGSSSSSSDRKHISKELEVFEVTSERTKNIDLLYDAIQSVPPTSVESERAFSAAGIFVTKLRTRLSDKSINAICLLRGYYISDKHSK